MDFFNPAAPTHPCAHGIGHPARHKAKNAIFAFLHFSNTYGVFEKWRPIRGPHAGCFSTAR
jgi:hypothetical protein